MEVESPSATTSLALDALGHGGRPMDIRSHLEFLYGSNFIGYIEIAQIKPAMTGSFSGSVRTVKEACSIKRLSWM
jgi:hypothetical protein